MKISDNLAFFIVGALLTAGLVVSAFFMEGFNRYIQLGLVFCLPVPLMIGGAYGLLKERKTGVKENTENRTTASVLAMIPGFGHFYFSKNLKGFLFLIGFSAGAVVFALGLASLSLENTSGTADVLYIYGALTAFTVWLWSILDVNRICNERGLKKASELDTAFKKTDLLLTIFLLSMFFLFVLSSAGMIIYMMVDDRIGIAIALLSLLLPIFVFLNYRHKKRNGTWQLY